MVALARCSKGSCQLACCSMLAAALLAKLAEASCTIGSCPRGPQYLQPSSDASLLLRTAIIQRRPALKTEAGSNANAGVNPHIGVVDEELEMLGCYRRSENDADESPLYIDRACANASRSGGSAMPRCRSGLPFYRLPLQAGQTYLDCFGFCLSKGLDVCGILTTDPEGQHTECRCGASAANAAVWHWRSPPPALLLDDNSKLPTGDPDCKVLVWKYKGGLVDSAVPFPLLKLSAGDEAYIDSVALGSEHISEEDVPVGASTPMIDAMHVNLSLAATGRVAGLSRSGGYCKDYGVGERACSTYAVWCSTSSYVKTSCPLTCGLCTTGGWLSCYPNQCGPGGGPWPKASDGNVHINYYFEEGLDQARKDAFELAAAEWSSRTCIKFKYSTSTPRLAISKNNSATCSCGVGFPGVGGTNTLNMGWCDSETHVGTIIHEIGHGIGMNHEQNRPDAAKTYNTPAGQEGKYLEVYWNNIPGDWRSQFTPDESSYIGSTSLGGYAAYDYGSIMHYGQVAPGQPDWDVKSYTATNPLFNAVVGQRDALSDGDVNQALDMYQCSEPGPVAQLPCADEPNDWASLTGSTCSRYVSHELCTSSGGYGTSWRANYGTFDDWAVGGISADEACCGCGGGRPPCADEPNDWVSSTGSSCNDYVSYELCTSSGGYGTSWRANYGTFDDWAVGGISADEACCACGGGQA